MTTVLAYLMILFCLLDVCVAIFYDKNVIERTVGTRVFGAVISIIIIYLLSKLV
jgi:hypothetical protein